jgi:hypothetical protein
MTASVPEGDSFNPRKRAADPPTLLFPPFPQRCVHLSKNPPAPNPRNTAFGAMSTHSGGLTLAAVPRPMCVRWKTPYQTLSHWLVIQTTVLLRSGYGNRVPRAGPVSMRFPAPYPLFHAQRLLRLSIFSLSLCFLEAFSPGLKAGCFPSMPRVGTDIPAPHKTPPEIHSLGISHEPPSRP